MPTVHTTRKTAAKQAISGSAAGTYHPLSMRAHQARSDAVLRRVTTMVLSASAMAPLGENGPSGGELVMPLIIELSASVRTHHHALS